MKRYFRSLSKKKRQRSLFKKIAKTYVPRYKRKSSFLSFKKRPFRSSSSTTALGRVAARITALSEFSSCSNLRDLMKVLFRNICFVCTGRGHNASDCPSFLLLGKSFFVDQQFFRIMHSFRLVKLPYSMLEKFDPSPFLSPDDAKALFALKTKFKEVCHLCGGEGHQNYQCKISLSRLRPYCLTSVLKKELLYLRYQFKLQKLEESLPLRDSPPQVSVHLENFCSSQELIAHIAKSVLAMIKESK